MSAKAALYKASIDREIRPPEIESLVAANGGLIYRSLTAWQGQDFYYHTAGTSEASLRRREKWPETLPTGGPDGKSKSARSARSEGPATMEDLIAREDIPGRGKRGIITR
jgi:hypothetical protein